MSYLNILQAAAAEDDSAGAATKAEAFCAKAAEARLEGDWTWANRLQQLADGYRSIAWIRAEQALAMQATARAAQLLIARTKDESNA